MPLIHQSDDILQIFWTHLNVHKGLKNVTDDKGKFSSFLLTVLRNCQMDLVRESLALRRRGDHVPLDEHEAELSNGEPSMGQDLDREVAMETYDKAMKLLSKRYEGHFQNRFEVLKAFVLSDEKVDYEALRLKLDLKPGAARKAIHDMRRSFWECFRSQVSQMAARENVDEEMRYLKALLSHP